MCIRFASALVHCRSCVLFLHLGDLSEGACPALYDKTAYLVNHPAYPQNTVQDQSTWNLIENILKDHLKLTSIEFNMQRAGKKGITLPHPVRTEKPCFVFLNCIGLASVLFSLGGRIA